MYVGGRGIAVTAPVVTQRTVTQQVLVNICCNEFDPHRQEKGTNRAECNLRPEVHYCILPVHFYETRS